MSGMHIKLGMGLLFLLVSIIAIVVAAALITKGSKNGERLRMIKQATSGRWLLTVGAMMSFLGLSLGVFIVLVSMRYQLNTATAVALFSNVLLIIQGVYKDYFRRDGNGNHRDDAEAPEPEPKPKIVYRLVAPDGSVLDKGTKDAMLLAKKERKLKSEDGYRIEGVVEEE